MGNVGQEPKVNAFKNGGKIAQLSLATTKRGFTTKSGKEVQERTEWHNVILVNGLATVAEQYVKKGDKIYIEGELRNRTYTDKDGRTRYITEIYATELELLSPKKDDGRKAAMMPDAADYADDLPEGF